MDENDVPTDPTTVSVTVEPGPGQPRVTYAFTADGVNGWSHVTGTGIYQLALDTTGTNGQFTCKWQGNGAVQVPGIHTFDVTEAPF